MVRDVDLAAATRPLPSVSAVLPAFNEAANLEQTIRDLAPVLRRACTAFEIIVVNDGSSDRTVAVAAKVAATIPDVVVLDHPQNRGYGAALRTGFAAARREWILLLDADGQFDPQEIPRFLTALQGADLILGYREKRADPFHRRLYAICWSVLIRGLLRVRIRDLNCGFKLMRTALVQSLDLTAEGAFISPELLAKAYQQGARTVEIPVTHRPRRHGRQSGGDVRVLLRAFYELGKLWWKLRQAPQAARGS